MDGDDLAHVFMDLNRKNLKDHFSGANALRQGHPKPACRHPKPFSFGKLYRKRSLSSIFRSLREKKLADHMQVLHAVLCDVAMNLRGFEFWKK